MSLDVGWGPDGQSGGENPFDFVLPDKNEPTTSWRWATVVSSAPLRVTLDGDDSPLLATPWDMGSPAPRIPGDRVYCQINARRVVILGPTGAAVADATPNGHLAGAAGRLVKWGSNSTITVPDPTGAYDVANKRYVDQVLRAVELGANVNLDSVVEPGAYVQSQNAETSTALNYPEASAGLLEVYGLGTSTGMRWQRYSVYNSVGALRTVYQRSYYSPAGWSAWSMMYDPTAGWHIKKWHGGNWSLSSGSGTNWNVALINSGTWSTSESRNGGTATTSGSGIALPSGTFMITVTAAFSTGGGGRRGVSYVTSSTSNAPQNENMIMVNGQTSASGAITGTFQAVSDGTNTVYPGVYVDAAGNIAGTVVIQATRVGP